MSLRLEGGEGVSTIGSNHTHDMILFALLQHGCRDLHCVRGIPCVERPAEFQSILQNCGAGMIPRVNAGFREHSLAHRQDPSNVILLRRVIGCRGKRGESKVQVEVLFLAPTW